MKKNEDQRMKSTMNEGWESVCACITLLMYSYLFFPVPALLGRLGE